MLKNTFKFALLAGLITTLCFAQQSSIQKEGGSWTSTVNGSLSGVRNLHIKVEVGAVRVEGGSSQGITYVIRNRSYESSEDRARRQFEQYKISSYTRGDTAWIVGDWQGGRPHKFSSEVTVSVPRDMELVKIETEGGNIVTAGISGRLEAESGGGSIHLDDISGAINAETWLSPPCFQCRTSRSCGQSTTTFSSSELQVTIEAMSVKYRSLCDLPQFCQSSLQCHVEPSWSIDPQPLTLIE